MPSPASFLSGYVILCFEHLFAHTPLPFKQKDEGSKFGIDYRALNSFCSTGCDIPSKAEEVNQLLQQRNDILIKLKQNLLKAQDQMRAQETNHRRLFEFVMGDWVYLKIQPYKLKSLAKRPFAKLASHFCGPYQILSKVGTVAYKLNLPTH